MSIAGYNKRHLAVVIPDPTADAKVAILKAPLGGIRIVAASASVQTAVTADGTNYISMNLLDGGADGTGTTSLYTRTGGASVGWDANELHDLTAGSQVELDEGAHLIFQYDENGTVAPGHVSVVVEYVQGGSE